MVDENPDGPSSAMLMFVAHRAAENRVYEALIAAGFDDLTMAQCRLAQRLSPEGIRATELAEQAQVTKQTAGALLDQLEHNGYVERRQDPDDARARLVHLSRRGRALCERAAAEVAAIETEWRNQLGAKAYRELRQGLERLRDLTDPYQ